MIESSKLTNRILIKGCAPDRLQRYTPIWINRIHLNAGGSVSVSRVGVGCSGRVVGGIVGSIVGSIVGCVVGCVVVSRGGRGGRVVVGCSGSRLLS